MRRGERGARPRRAQIRYELPDGYLLALWQWQRGLCFYTDRPMGMSLGTGTDPNSVSVDRVDASKGYIPGNVVLCLHRVNSVKQDLSLEEMREWTPGWYARVIERLPALTASVVAQPDGRPRNAAGRRTPTWIVERRRRLELLKQEHLSSLDAAG